MPRRLTPVEFQAIHYVSRETLTRLETYADLLSRWQGPVSLVSRRSLDDLWRRHMLDSAQLWPLLPATTRVVVDLGSGAGFPGLVLAILGVPEVHLIESNARKCAFLREAARLVAAPAVVHRSRIEDLAPFRADAVTARAIAPLPKLLGLAAPFLGPDGVCLFLKGGRVKEELTEAAKLWHMTVERVQSISDPSGTVLRMTVLRTKGDSCGGVRHA